MEDINGEGVFRMSWLLIAIIGWVINAVMVFAAKVLANKLSFHIVDLLILIPYSLPAFVLSVLIKDMLEGTSK